MKMRFIFSLKATKGNKRPVLQLEASNNVNTAVTKPWIKFKISCTKKGLIVGLNWTMMRTSIEYRKRATFLFRQAGTSYLAHVKGSLRKSQGHPTDRFGKLSVRKAFNPLWFAEENCHLELSWFNVCCFRIVKKNIVLGTEKGQLSFSERR